MKNILTKRWNYSLQENKKGEMIISVLCGTVGLYEIEVVLSEIERKKISDDGENFLDGLANDIRNNPNKYKDRQIR
jgi:hypothetical protein